MGAVCCVIGELEGDQDSWAGERGMRSRRVGRLRWGQKLAEWRPGERKHMGLGLDAGLRGRKVRHFDATRPVLPSAALGELCSLCS